MDAGEGSIRTVGAGAPPYDDQIAAQIRAVSKSMNSRKADLVAGIFSTNVIKDLGIAEAKKPRPSVVGPVSASTACSGCSRSYSMGWVRRTGRASCIET